MSGMTDEGFARLSKDDQITQLTMQRDAWRARFENTLSPHELWQLKMIEETPCVVVDANSCTGRFGTVAEAVTWMLRMRARYAGWSAQVYRRVTEGDEARHYICTCPDCVAPKKPGPQSLTRAQVHRLFVNSPDERFNLSEPQFARLVRHIERVHQLPRSDDRCDGNHGGAACADPECWQR